MREERKEFYKSWIRRLSPRKSSSVSCREKGRGNGQWREASRCSKEDVSIRKGGNAPLCTRLGVMKCSLHPVFYVLLGFSLPRCILLLLPSIRVKWLWISVSNCGRLKQPANLSAIFHRLSPRSCISFLPSSPFSFFLSPFVFFFYPFFARQPSPSSSTSEKRQKPRGTTHFLLLNDASTNVRTISKILDCIFLFQFLFSLPVNWTGYQSRERMSLERSKDKRVSTSFSPPPLPPSIITGIRELIGAFQNFDANIIVVEAA